MAKLYELVGNYRSLMEMSDDEGGEEFLAVMETLSGAIDNKVETCAKVVKNLEADKDSLKAEEERLSKRRKSIEGNIDRLKSYMREQMEGADKKKIKTALFTISVIKGREKVDFVDESLVPADYRKDPEPPAPKKKEILAAPGARIIVGDPSLSIR